MLTSRGQVGRCVRGSWLTGFARSAVDDANRAVCGEKSVQFVWIALLKGLRSVNRAG